MSAAACAVVVSAELGPASSATPFPRPCCAHAPLQLEHPRRNCALAVQQPRRAARLAARGAAWPTVRAATAAARRALTSALCCSTPTPLSQCFRRWTQSSSTQVRTQRARWPARLRCASGAYCMSQEPRACITAPPDSCGRVSRIAPTRAGACCSTGCSPMTRRTRARCCAPCAARRRRLRLPSRTCGCAPPRAAGCGASSSSPQTCVACRNACLARARC